MPTVSVAICTHNGAGFLEDQLRSIAAQTRRPDEVVLSDDASTDDTVAIAEKVAPETALPMRVIRNPVAQGVTRNFESAIEACTSEFIVLADQDDVWSPHRIERALEEFAAHPELSLVFSDARLVDEAAHPIGPTLFEALEVGHDQVELIRAGRGVELLMKRNVVTGATVMLRRELAQLAVPFPASWIHDEWLALVSGATGGLGVIDEGLIDYRQHGANQIGVRKLGLAGKARRMLEPGAARSARLLDRARDLAARVPEFAPELQATANEKLLHERVRSALPQFRLARIAPVLRELRTGRYSAFGRGAIDAARDLLQPLKPGR
ncbi:MAG TPA: glycosyltransferase family 2 protein [Pseudolysinimonas sp.]|nr:glycosyltransferase family 2 protein [Pseudolysinimonas sp.]